MPEPVAAVELINTLNTKWNRTNVLLPKFFDINGPNRPARVDLKDGDYLLIKLDSLEEIPIGNWLYVNRVTRMSIEVWTKESRERLYNLIREIRRICHDQRHSMTHYQRMQFSGFTEHVVEDVNRWNATVLILLESNAVLAETT